jgi:hypothetical protein
VRPTSRAVIDASKEDFEPLRLTSNDPEATAPDRVVIAYLDDYELSMPAKMPASIALKVMRAQRKEGEAQAMMLMLEEVLGDEGFTKLIEWDSLTDDNLVDLFAVVQHVAMGAMETPKSSS